MAIKVEAYGTRQKKTCYGCGSMISFENEDIQGTEPITYIECPICGKKIKAHKVDRTVTKETEVGKKAKAAFEGEPNEETWS